MRNSIMIFDPKTGPTLESGKATLRWKTPAKGKMGIFGGYNRTLYWNRTMKKILFCALLLACHSIWAEKPASSRSSSERDYAIMTGSAVQRRGWARRKTIRQVFCNTWNSHRRALLDQTPYVAIQVRDLTAGDIPWLVNRLFHGSARSMD